MFGKINEEIELGQLCCTQYIRKKRKNRLRWSIKKFGYNPTDDDLIIVSKDYEIIDGNHRYCALLELKGVFHKVKVHKLRISKNMYYSLLSVWYVFLFISSFFLIFLYFN